MKIRIVVFSYARSRKFFRRDLLFSLVKRTAVILGGNLHKGLMFHWGVT